jgi:hypothetical protein
MRTYGKVHISFWSNSELQGSSDDARILALYLLSSPHTNMLGCFRLPAGYFLEDFQGWTAERLKAAFVELSTIGFADRDPVTQWVVVYKFLKWNPVENPNQAKAIIRLFERLPMSGPIRGWAASALNAYLSTTSRGVWEPFLNVGQPVPNPSETVSEPFRNQEQEQEQKQEGPPEANPSETVPEPFGADAPPSSSNDEADLYRRGKAVLGPKGGGLVRKLVKAKGGNVALARGAIEVASTKGDPREYLGAIIRAQQRSEVDAHRGWDPGL